MYKNCTAQVIVSSLASKKNSNIEEQAKGVFP